MAFIWGVDLSCTVQDLPGLKVFYISTGEQNILSGMEERAWFKQTCRNGENTQMPTYSFKMRKYGSLKAGADSALHNSRGHNSYWGSGQGHAFVSWSKLCTLEGKWLLDFTVEETEAKINIFEIYLRSIFTSGRTWAQTQIFWFLVQSYLSLPVDFLGYIPYDCIYITFPKWHKFRKGGAKA